MNMFSKSGNSYSGPLLSAMQTFGNGVEEGLTSVETAVKSYNTSQVQDVVDAFEEQFCTEAKYEAPEKKPLNFTGKHWQCRDCIQQSMTLLRSAVLSPCP